MQLEIRFGLDMYDLIFAEFYINLDNGVLLTLSSL